MKKYLKDCYPNKSGCAHIFSWTKYSAKMREPKLETTHDRENLKTLFQTLGYGVIMHNNLTKEATKSVLNKIKFSILEKSFSQILRYFFFSELRRNGSKRYIFFAFLSHGDKGSIQCYDSDLSTEYIENKIGTLNLIIEKPKIILLQCLGNQNPTNY